MSVIYFILVLFHGLNIDKLNIHQVRFSKILFQNWDILISCYVPAIHNVAYINIQKIFNNS